jgi:acyl-CoA dehydrogenase
MTGSAPLVELAASIAVDVLAPRARAVDRAGAYPAHNLRALHDAGLMAVFLPRELGGHSVTVQTYGAIAAALAEECASTAMVWAMHGQQVITLLEHGGATHRQWLERAGRQGFTIGSVTTDTRGGADLFATGDALVPEGDRLRVTRTAPVVTGGASSGCYLVSMRAHPDAALSDSRLVLVDPADGLIEEKGSWDALGMRGTHSVPMRIDAVIDHDRVLSAAFSRIAAETLVPVGHVGWASVWLGAMRGAAERVRAAIRARRLKAGGATSDLLLSRLAEVRLSIDLLTAMIRSVAQDADEALARRRAGVPAEPLDPVRVNSLKLAGSRLALKTANLLVEIGGMRDGYLCTSDLALERTLRDVRSASLMFHNDRLLQANGRLVLIGSAGLVGLSDTAQRNAQAGSS